MNDENNPQYLIAWCEQDNNIDPPCYDDYYIVTDDLRYAESKYEALIKDKDTYSANIATIIKSTDYS